MATLPTLNLVHETKISELVGCAPQAKHWEASGVFLKDGYCFVVFDNGVQIGRFADDLQPNSHNQLLGPKNSKHGYEGITYNSVKQRFYLLVEATEVSKDDFQAIVVEYDSEFRRIKQRPLAFKLPNRNKGFEAISYVRRNDQDHVLTLCEGNHCRGGVEGRTPGAGRIQLFIKKRDHWSHFKTINLPSSLPFEDYSGMSICDGRVAVVSQTNSMLWVGQFDEHQWQWCDGGRLYEFPRSEDGAILYGNIEGVAWVSPTRILAVSDRRKKKDQPDKRLKDKDQSVHIFDVPPIESADANDSNS